MLVTYLRSSLYGGYSFCEHKSFLNYVLGLQEDGNKKAELGSAMHKVAECLALCKLKQKETGEIGGWNIGDEYIGEFTPTNMFDNRIIPKLCKMSFDYYSSLSKHIWTDKDLITLIEWVNKIVSFQDGAFDPRSQDVVAVEQYFDFEIADEWAKYNYVLGDKEISGNLAMKGTIDLIMKVDDDHYEVLDYKSGRRLDWATGQEKTLDKLQVDPQLLIYYYACRRIFPDIEHFDFTIYYVNDGGPYTVCFDNNSLILAENLIRNRFEEMRDNQKPKLLNPSQQRRDKDFKCKNLCHFYKNNYPDTDISICEYFQNKVKESSADLVTLEYGDFARMGVYGDGGGRKSDEPKTT